MMKPCPFCGSEKVKVRLAWSLQGHERGIHCLECDAFMTTGWFESTDEQLMRLWDRRAGDDASD